MQKITSTTLTILVLLMAIHAWGAGELNFSDLVKGNTVPLTMTLKQMQTEGNWRVFSLKEGAEGVITQAITDIMARECLKLPQPVLFTKGETITCGEETFLVTYQESIPVFDVESIMAGYWGDEDGKPVPVFLSDESPLKLSLLNQRSLGNITGIKPLNIKELLAAETALKARYDAKVKKERRNQAYHHMYRTVQRFSPYIYSHNQPFPQMTDTPQLMAALQMTPEEFTQHGQQVLYAVNPILSGRKPKQIARRDKMVVFYEAIPDEDGGRHIANLYGNVEYVTTDEWETLKKWSRITETAPVPAIPAVAQPTPITAPAPALPTAE